MQTKKNKKAAVYFSAGIGDALLLTPLIKILKADGYHITGIFTSKYNVHELYDVIQLLDDKLILLSKPKLVWFITRYTFIPFDISILNTFSARKSNLAAAAKTSKKVYTNKKVDFTYDVPENIVYIEPKENIHDALQNALLYKSGVSISETDFHIDHKNQSIDHLHLPTSYVTLQVGAGNNETPYKIWDVKKWNELVAHINKDFPDKQIVLLGDKHEIKINQLVEGKNIHNLSGKTTLKELVAIVDKCTCFIGSDSGLMHLAAALNKPTYTIWGASNEKLYAYNSFNSEKHKLIFNTNSSCRPCSAWIGANTSRLSDPNTCPDFMCLSTLESTSVYQNLRVFLSQH